MQEYYSSQEPERFRNKDMDRGNELEDSAAFLYQVETGQEIQKVGFVEHSEHVGCSPDLFVFRNGMAEIKCPDDKVYFQYLLDGKIDTKYQWQMRGQMWLYDRDWCDFVSYCPDFPESKQLYIFRVDRDEELEGKLIARLYEFEKTMQAYINILDQ